MKPLAGKKLLHQRRRATPIDTGADNRVPVDSAPDQRATPAAPCVHIPMKAKLDSSVWCIRCNTYLGEAN